MPIIAKRIKKTLLTLTGDSIILLSLNIQDRYGGLE